MDETELRNRVYYVHAPIDRWGRFGMVLRRSLLKLILLGTPINLFLQRHRCGLLNPVMKMFSFLGLEDFFTPLIIFLLWVVEAKFGVLFMFLLTAGFYSASFFKCLLCLPRPPSPPVIPVTRENKDWAVPSNHSIMGILMPWFIWYYSRGMALPEWLDGPLLALMIIWSTGVMFSRLYLGVHSLIDLVLGVLIGIVLLHGFLPIRNFIYHHYLSNKLLGWLSPLAVIVLLKIHPRSWPETQSYGESAVVLPCAAGMFFGRRLALGDPPARALLQTLPLGSISTSWLVVRAMLRFFLGAFVLLSFRILVKSFMRKLCFFFLDDLFELPVYSFSNFSKEHPQLTKHYTEGFRLPPQEGDAVEVGKKTDGDRNGLANGVRDYAHEQDVLEGAAEWDDPGHRPYDLDIPVRFVVYGGMGYLAVEIIPKLFRLFGI